MTDDELKGLFQGLRQDNTAIRGEMRREFAAVRQEAAAAHEETRRHFDVVASDLRKDTQVVSESVLHTQEQVARAIGALSEQVERSGAETRAMIKFSHTDLDRRMRTLEDTVADLQARVERLESSTH